MRSILPATLACGLLFSSPSFAQNCDSVGNDAISDANVANLYNMQAMAEQRAASARSYQERAQWEAQARAFAAQARAAETRGTSMAQLAREACRLLTDG